MKSVIFLMSGVFASFVYSAEITIVNNVNLRKTPSFLGSTNLSGQINKGASATILEVKTLPSGNKAYKISTESIKPAGSFTNSSGQKELWVYGSAHFVKAPEAVATVAGVKACTSCSVGPAVQPLRDIVQFVETQDAAAGISSDAQNMIESLRSYRKFVCDTRAEQIELRGIQCKGKLPGYPETVRFYIPKNYVKSEKSSLNIFFHGFETSGNIFQVNKNDRNGPGDFGARLADSGNNNNIVVVPESRGQGVTYQNYFQDRTGRNFQYFVSQIKQATESDFSSTTLAAHSGGYLPLNALLGYSAVASTIKRVALYDGSYYKTENITNWINSNSENRMSLSWVRNGDVEASTRAFIARVTRPLQLQQVPTNGTHMDNIREGGFSDFLKNN